MRFGFNSRGAILGKPGPRLRLIGAISDGRAFVAAVFDARRRCTPVNVTRSWAA